MMARRCTRRGFVKQGAGLVGACAAAPWIAPHVLAEPSLGSKLRVAVIGAGGMGRYAVGEAAKEQPIALVDVDEGRLAQAMKEIGHSGTGKGPGPKVYHDYRKMFDECHKDLDVVLISTPDHHHGPAAIRSLRLGKATFVQKPVAHNLYETCALIQEAKLRKVPTQMGNQRHCGEPIRRLSEYIAAGAVGSVLETHTIMGRSFGGPKGAGRPPAKPVPPGLHWSEWLGPAPYRDYHDGLHPFSWRSWRQFGTGTLGDNGCHYIDFAFMALRLGEAKRFTIECLQQTGGSEEMYPQDNVVCWEFPARSNMPPVKLYSYDHAGLKPPVMAEAEKKHNRNLNDVTLFVGDKGLIGADARIIPETRHKEFPVPPKTLPRVQGGPIADLFQACKTGTTPCSNFIDAAGPLTVVVLTGVLAMAAGPGKKLQWDMDSMQCVNYPEINKYLRREYRQGWEV